MFRGSKLLF